MKQRAKAPPQFAIYINNSEYPASLELHKIYRVLPDEDAEKDGDLRVIDESGEDYLFPAGYFITLELPPEVQRVWYKHLLRIARRYERSRIRKSLCDMYQRWRLR